MADIKRDPNIASGIAGITQILGRYTSRSAPRYNQLGKLTDEELVTIYSCASNEESSLINGLRTLGDLVSGYDKEFGELDHNGVGWLVKQLAESLEEMLSVQWLAHDELTHRGRNCHGHELYSTVSKAA